MKRNRYVHAGIVLRAVFLTACLMAVPSYGANLLAGYNGNFELGTSSSPTNWTIDSQYFTYNQGWPPEGQNYGLVGTNGQIHHSGAGLTYLDPGKTYRITFYGCYWGWDSGDSPSVKFNTGMGWEEDIKTFDYPPPTTYWTKHSAEFTGLRQIYLVIRGNGASLGTDDYWVEEVPDRSPNLLRYGNANFEGDWNNQSTPQNGWSYSGGSGFDAVTNATWQGVHEGYHAVRLNEENERIEYTGYLTGRDLNPALTYEVTIWAKVTGYESGDSAKIGYIVDSTDTPIATLTANTPAGTAGDYWQKFTGTFTDATDFDFYAERLGSGDTEVLVDTFELREVDTVEFPFTITSAQRIGWDPDDSQGTGYLCVDRSVITNTDGGVQWSEVPPTVVQGGYRQLYYASGDSFWVAVHPDYDYPYGPEVWDPTYNHGPSAWNNLTFYRETNQGAYPTDTQLENMGNWWRKNYWGIFSALKATVDSNTYVFGVYHGENKNELKWEGQTPHYYVNSLRPQDTGGYSGYDPTAGEYVDYWPAYFASVNIAISPSVSQTLWGQDFMVAGYTVDFGPVLWPSNAYIDTQNPPGQASNGLRHPSAFIDDGYMYIFFKDQGGIYTYGSESGREEGIKAARAPVATCWAGNWKNLFNGEWNTNSMPASAVTDPSDPDAWAEKGGQCNRIHRQLDNDAYRFYVSELTTGGYLGVESYFIKVTGYPSSVATALRYSPDLIHWSPREWVPNTVFDEFWEAEMNYAVLMTPDGWSNNPINPSEFLILGGHGQGKKTGVMEITMSSNN